MSHYLLLTSSSILQDYQEHPDTLDATTWTASPIETSTPMSTKILLQTLYYVQKKASLPQFLKFIQYVLSSEMKTIGDMIDVLRAVKRKEVFIKNYWTSLKTATYIESIRRACDFVIQYNLPLNSEVDNGQVLETMNIQLAIQSFSRDIRLLAEGIHEGQVTSIKQIRSYLDQQSVVMPLYFPSLYQPYSEQTFLSLGSMDTVDLLEQSFYLYTEDWEEEAYPPLTLVVGLDLQKDLDSLMEVIHGWRSLHRCRLMILNTNPDNEDQYNWIVYLLYSLFHQSSIPWDEKIEDALQFVDSIQHTQNRVELKTMLRSTMKSIVPVEDVDVHVVEKITRLQQLWRAKTSSYNRLFVLLNGRVLPNLKNIQAPFIQLLDKEEHSRNSQFYASLHEKPYIII